MDNNLSKEITAERVATILKEDTDSGLSRLYRIELNNPNLFERLGKPKRVTKTIAEELINWSESIFKNSKKSVNGAKKELNEYCKLIDEFINSLDDLDKTMKNLNNFQYIYLSEILTNISQNSKIVNRVNNLKLLCALYTNNSNSSAKNYLYEYIIRELYAQKSFFIILKKNLEGFENDSFALGLLLYDIPGIVENQLNFLAELKKHRIKM